MRRNGRVAQASICLSPPKQRGAPSLTFSVEGGIPRSYTPWICFLASTAIHAQSVCTFIDAFHILRVPSVALYVVECRFLGGFESLPLRHAVWTAEKSRTLCAEIREKCPYSRLIPRQTGPRRIDYSASYAVPGRLFFGRHIRSPVSSRASGECNAIRSWDSAPSELTSG